MGPRLAEGNFTRGNPGTFGKCDHTFIWDTLLHIELGQI